MVNNFLSGVSNRFKGVFFKASNCNLEIKIDIIIMIHTSETIPILVLIALMKNIKTITIFYDAHRFESLVCSVFLQNLKDVCKLFCNFQALASLQVLCMSLVLI